MTMPSDQLALLRSRSYVALLVLAAIIGVPVSAAAYFFLALVSKLQGWIFTDLPKGSGLPRRAAVVAYSAAAAGWSPGCPHVPPCGTVSEQAQIHGALNRVQAGGRS